MSTGTMMEQLDDRGIPRIDPAVMPQVVEGDRDWRAELDQLREKYPVFRVGSSPAIWFTRFEAARDIMNDGELFYDTTWVEEFGAKDALVKKATHKTTADDVCPAEGLKHQLSMRQAVMGHFAPKYVRNWEGRMQELARDLIEGFKDKGECDFVKDFAMRYFPHLGCEWIGVAPEDTEYIVDLVHKVFLLQPKAGDDRTLEMAGKPMVDILAYLEKLMDSKRKEPDNSFTSFLLEARIGDRTLTDEEVRGALTIAVLGSGHTVSSHLAYVFRHLADHPEHRRLIIDEPEVVPQLGEELLREYSLFGHSRLVMQDVDDFHGVPLKRGDEVFVMYGMANRDPRCPGFDQVDPTRSPNPHMAFNVGPRRCIGMHWARSARDIALREWHAQIPDYRIKDGAVLVDQIYAGTGYRSLPLVWS